MSETKDPSKDTSSKAGKDIEKSLLLVAVQSDLGLLRTGEHADFVIHCGDRKWRVHKSFLARCPYYAALLNKDRKWKEHTEAKSVIEEFEPFEVNWLIQYIYCPAIDANDLINEVSSKSFLEVCARLWRLGDYFLFKPLKETAVKQLEHRVEKFMMKATHVATVLIDGVPFMDELEAAIRLAWSARYHDSAVRKPLVALFKTVQAFLHKNPSCVKLLEEVPDFSVDFAKATLGLDGDEWYHITNSRDGHLNDYCEFCQNDVEIIPKWDPESRPKELNTIMGLPGYSCATICNRCAEKHGAFRDLKSEGGFHPDCPHCESLPEYVGR